MEFVKKGDFEKIVQCLQLANIDPFPYSDGTSVSNETSFNCDAIAE